MAKIHLLPTRTGDATELLAAIAGGSEAALAEFYRFHQARIYSFIVRRVAKTARHIVTVSDFSRRRLLEEYPSCDNGLSRVERQALEALRDHGPLTPVELFAANAAKEESIYLGDAVFFRYLANLKPLIEDNAITPLGIEVLEGKRDWLAIKPAGRWIGGVHFEGANPAWRWDARMDRIGA